MLQAQYNEEAAENALLRPAFCAAMAQPLYEVIARRLDGPAEPAAGRSKRRKQAPAAQEEAHPAAEQQEVMQDPAPLPRAEAPADFDHAHHGMAVVQLLAGLDLQKNVLWWITAAGTICVLLKESATIPAA